MLVVCSQRLRGRPVLSSLGIGRGKTPHSHTVLCVTKTHFFRYRFVSTLLNIGSDVTVETLAGVIFPLPPDGARVAGIPEFECERTSRSLQKKIKSAPGFGEGRQDQHIPSLGEISWKFTLMFESALVCIPVQSPLYLPLL